MDELRLTMPLPDVLVALIASFLPHFLVSDLALSTVRAVLLLCPDRLTQWTCQRQLRADLARLGASFISHVSNAWEIRGHAFRSRFLVLLDNERWPCSVGRLEAFEAAHVVVLPGVSNDFFATCQSFTPRYHSCELDFVAPRTDHGI
jgi:hypothetical protein